MATYNSGVRYDSGVRYSGPVPPTNNTMKAIKLELSKKNVLEKVAQGKGIHTGILANPTIYTDPPDMPGLLAVVTNLETAKATQEQAIEASRQATDAVHAAEAAYDTKITLVGIYAENVTQCDGIKLEAGGFQLRKNPTHVTELGTVDNVKVATNGFPGLFKVTWDKLGGAMMFEPQINLADPPTDTGWLSVMPSSAAKTTINGLPSGERVSVRVRGVTKDIFGPWSNPVSHIVT